MDRNQLLQLSTALRALADRYGARSLSVYSFGEAVGYGSVVRGEAGPTSDVDLLVDFPSSPTFEQYMDLKLAIEDLLQRPVDLITRTGLRQELSSRIEAEALRVA